MSAFDLGEKQNPDLLRVCYFLIAKLSFLQWEGYMDGETQISASDFPGSQSHESVDKALMGQNMPSDFCWPLCWSPSSVSPVDSFGNLFGFGSCFSACQDEFQSLIQSLYPMQTSCPC